MRRALAAALLALPTAAHAGLGDRTAGVYLDAAGGLGAAFEMPVGVGAEVGVGGWTGKVDDAFSIGRTWSFGVRAHTDFAFEPDKLDTRTAVTLEFHRTIYLLVVALKFGAQAGPVLRLPDEVSNGRCDKVVDCDGLRPALGGTALIDASLVYRFHRAWGLQLKGEVGVDVGATGYPVAPVGGVLLGLMFEAPVKHKVAAVVPFTDPVDEHWSEPEVPPQGEPTTPGEPDAPATPALPDGPATPDAPATPDGPVTPDAPAPPAAPTFPGEPG